MDDRDAMKRQVREASDIVAIIGSYINVLPHGRLFKAVCPFHDDTRPSLQIDPQWQNYRCWACQKKGDVFTFVCDYEKVNFREALEILAKRAGINLQGAPQENTKRIKLLETVRWAEAKYHDALLETDELGARARIYLGQRKLVGSTIRSFKLGYAPNAGDWLVREAQADGIDFDLLREVGLIADRREHVGCYDRFRDRVMFPIRDARGQTVGFGGRILPDSPLAERGPKYYNSSETPLFLKQELLYGLDVARHAGATEGYLAVVEGYTDVMMAHQCGITNVVATMGTALNKNHVKQLRRFVPKVVLVFDADEGGTTGVDRALEVFINNDVDLTIATLPDGLDPCDLLTSQGPEPFKKALASATDALDFKLTQLLTNAGNSVEAIKRVVDSILNIMALAPDIPGQTGQVKQELLMTRLAQRLGLRQETLWTRFGELKAAKKREATRLAPPTQKVTAHTTPEQPVRSAPADPLERQLLEILLAEPALVAKAYLEVRPEELKHQGLQKLLAGLYHLLDHGETPNLDNLRDNLNHPALSAKAYDLQETGRGIPDRSGYLRKVLDAFRDRIRATTTRQVKDRLTTETSYEAQLELLRILQARSKGPDITGSDSQSGSQSP
jgi:DNA primase